MILIPFVVFLFICLQSAELVNVPKNELKVAKLVDMEKGVSQMTIG